MLLDTWLIDEIVAAGESGGEGTQGLSRNLVASDAELAEDSSGDNGLSRSYDLGCRISGDFGDRTLIELPRDTASGLIDSLRCELDRSPTGVIGRPEGYPGLGDLLA